MRKTLFFLVFAFAIATGFTALPAYVNAALQAPLFSVSASVWDQQQADDRVTVSVSREIAGHTTIECGIGSPFSRAVEDPYVMQSSGQVRIYDGNEVVRGPQSTSISQVSAGFAGECGVDGMIGEIGTFSASSVTFQVGSLDPGSYNARVEICALSGSGCKTVRTDFTISRPTDGQCGTAAKTYGHDEAFPGSYTYCAVSSNSPSPSAPSPGGSTSWQCLGKDGGNDVQCTASRQARLSVSKNGSGTVSGTGISCGSDCSQDYNPGTSVSLSASPASGSTFAGWSGACSGTGSCSVTMNADKSVTATFNAAVSNYTLSVNSSGVSGVSITSEPSGFGGSTNYPTTLSAGASVRLTAQWTSGGKDFANWSGCDSIDAANQCRINSISANRTVTANYVDPPASTECTISISSNVATTWSLTGPESRTQSSPSTGETYSNMDEGTYTLAADPVAGYTGPEYSPSSSQTCTGGDTISFNVSYTEDGEEPPPPPEGESPTLSVSPTSATVGVGGAQQFSANYDPDGSGSEPSQDVTGSANWSSSNTSIASETATAGEFIGNAAGGPVTITADYDPGSGNLSGDAQLTVSGGPLDCDNGEDDDGDGLTDLDDPGCSDSSDNDERDSFGLTQCSDEVDNDGDGNIDYPNDPNCDSFDDNSEAAPQCSDGIDNDGDGFIDFPDDLQCTSAGGTSESGPPVFEEF